MTIFLIALGAVLTTFLGGLFTLRFRDKLHLILGFSAGAVIGVALFDLLPEALNLGGVFYDEHTVMAVVALGFVAYMILDRVVILHSHSDDHCENPSHESRGKTTRGIVGAASLSTHSLLDGMAVGVAFQVSPAIGSVVAIAVLTHAFTDGINTVNMIVKNGGSKKLAFKWLWVDALAPVIGIMLAFFFQIPKNVLGLLLAAFAGFFLYIGASDLLPESHHGHSTVWTSVLTILGIAILYLAVLLAH